MYSRVIIALLLKDSCSGNGYFTCVLQIENLNKAMPNFTEKLSSLSLIISIFKDYILKQLDVWQVRKERSSKTLTSLVLVHFMPPVFIKTTFSSYMNKHQTVPLSYTEDAKRLCNQNATESSSA